MVNKLAPADRGVAMVFQSYALYPHMTIYDNMAFNLKLAKTEPAEIERRVLNATKDSATGSVVTAFAEGAVWWSASARGYRAGDCT